MPDREKVIRALECLTRNEQGGTCNGCAYFRPFENDPDTGLCDRMAAMADALAMLREQEKAGWISTKERQPNVMEIYLVRLADGTYRILGYYDYIDFDKEPRWLEDYTAEELVEVPNVTHWMPLPEPPEEVKWA